MAQQPPENPWQTILLQPRFPWTTEPIRPADVIQKLRDVMLAKGNMIEDANYHKVVPNHYIVELSPENYSRNYQPIEKRVIQQWREKMLEFLATANGRQGRKEYTFGGPVEIEIRPAADLSGPQARVLSRLDPGLKNAPSPSLEGMLPACLEGLVDGRKWRLQRGVVTLGREPQNDIYLDAPIVQEKRLVSGQHAYLRCDEGQYRLYDGSSGGRPSVNGTFVNYRPVPPEGRLLQEGDIIILAALNPAAPRQDTPGVVAMRFHLECRP